MRHFRNDLNSIEEGYTHCYAHCSIIYNSQDVEAAQVLTNRGMGTEYVIHTYTHTHIYIYILSCIYRYIDYES